MWKRLMACAVCCIMITQLAACGMILYPERKGQRPGRIDPGVAVLDAVGLLFFIIPGVIAFAVDFGTGAIYMPGSGTAAAESLEEMNVVRVAPAELSEERIETLVELHTGKHIDLAAEGVIMREVHSPEGIQHALAER